MSLYIESLLDTEDCMDCGLKKGKKQTKMTKVSPETMTHKNFLTAAFNRLAEKAAIICERCRGKYCKFRASSRSIDSASITTPASEIPSVTFSSASTPTTTSASPVIFSASNSNQLLPFVSESSNLLLAKFHAVLGELEKRRLVCIKCRRNQRKINADRTCEKCRKEQSYLLEFHSPNHENTPSSSRSPDSQLRFAKRKAIQNELKIKEAKLKEENKGMIRFLMSE